ncbi:C-type lectin LmsL-like [Heteronotia binoei]|uniref:C-type lectin LmsL-like n=1 Tax=Heteronotia binoei TaxID=13085 RepID=UPI00292CFFE4|nr:C-type lectin LmsL-like [Heteronotia binoei]
MTLFAGLFFCLLGSLLSSSWAEAAPQPELQAGTHCPFNTHSIKEGNAWYCYELYERPRSFPKAEVVCQQNRNGGHLASITSKKQTESIGGYISEISKEKARVWIGLYREQNSDLVRGWRWTDGSFFDYKNWVKGEPNNAGGDEFCVELTAESGFERWNDVSCSSEKSFLCRWRVL